jgi:Protein of unknown function (DUF1566)
MNKLRASTFSVGSLLLGCVLMAGCGSVTQGVPTDLSGVTQNWDKNLPVAQRFVILAGFNNDAILDKNTGLVWEKSPQLGFASWSGARFACVNNRELGGQKGWRLPSIPELASLIDPSVAAPGPTLLSGHPFLNVQSADYWSAAMSAEDPTFAWRVSFLDGSVLEAGKGSALRVWCVRGGMHADQY